MSNKLSKQLTDSQQAFRVLDKASKVLGDYKKAALWFCYQSSADTGYRTPYELCKEGKYKELLDTLDSYQAGPCG